MSEVDDLRGAAERAIEEAFPVAPVPSAEQVRNDHCPECSELAERFVGKAWPEITAADLGPNASPSILTTPAFRYYLPALMLSAMETREALDLLHDSLVSMLSPAGGKPSEHDRERLTTYTRGQTLAILAFLTHAEAAGDEESESSRRVVRRAIKYWNGLIEPSASLE